ELSVSGAAIYEKGSTSSSAVGSNRIPVPSQTKSKTVTRIPPYPSPTLTPRRTRGRTMPMIGPRRTMRSTRKPAGPTGLGCGSFRARSSREPRSCSIPRGPFRDLAELLQIRRDIVREDPGSRDEDVRAGPRRDRRRVELDPAIDLELDRQALTVDVFSSGLDLRDHVGSERLAREPGMHGHQEQQVDFPQIRDRALHREVRDKVSIHDVDVEHVGPRAHGLQDLLPEAVESRGEDRGGDLDGHRIGEMDRPE